jgi:hypothetical protein
MVSGGYSVSNFPITQLVMKFRIKINAGKETKNFVNLSGSYLIDNTIANILLWHR